MDEKSKKLSFKEIGLIVLFFVGFFLLGTLLFFLINLPIIFDFKNAPTVGKVFMIIGSVVVFFVLVLLCFAFKFSKKKTLKSFLIVAIIILYHLYVILGYFDFDIWGSKKYFWTVLSSLIILNVAYNFVSTFQDVFNQEKSVMLIVSIAVLLVSLFTFDILKDPSGNYIPIKIAIGLLYAVSIPSFIKATLLSNKKNDEKHLVFPLMLSIVFCAGIIISFPFYINWCGLSNENFETFLTIYSALIGGGITLSGVAWTIKKGELARKEEEKKKCKPVFLLNKLYIDPKVGVCNKFCFDGIKEFKEYQTTITSEVENSYKSILNMMKIYHDEKWWDIEGDTVLLPNQKVIFSFVFNGNANNLFLQIQDELGNNYYYEIEVLESFSLIDPDTNQEMKNNHTVKRVSEISLKEIREKIAVTKAKSKS